MFPDISHTLENLPTFTPFIYRVNALQMPNETTSMPNISTTFMIANGHMLLYSPISHVLMMTSVNPAPSCDPFSDPVHSLKAVCDATEAVTLTSNVSHVSLEQSVAFMGSLNVTSAVWLLYPSHLDTISISSSTGKKKVRLSARVYVFSAVHACGCM